MRHYKNLEMWEEKFNPKYHKKLRQEAKDRAELWKIKRRMFEYDHPYLTTIIISFILAAPFVTIVAIFSRRWK